MLDMEDAMRVPRDCANVAREGEAVLALPYAFETLQTNLTFFEPLIIHGDFSCKMELANGVTEILKDGRNASDHLQDFTHGLFTLTDEIYYQTKTVFEELSNLSKPWSGFPWIESTFVILIRDLVWVILWRPKELVLEAHRHVWIHYFDTVARKLDVLKARGANLVLSFAELEGDLTSIHSLASKEIKKVKLKLRDGRLKSWQTRSRVHVADFESQIKFLNDFDSVREAAYTIVTNVYSRLNDIQRHIAETRDKLSNPHLKTCMSLERQIEQIDNAVKNLDDTKQSMKIRKRALTAQETINAANALRSLED